MDQINSSKADFLAAALGAHKGQLWLKRNHDRIRIPVRAHLGATINFQAGIVRRAPHALRKLGLEWLWRIKEEPHLWRRYWHDGTVLLSLLVSNVLPLAITTRLQLKFSKRRRGFAVTEARIGDAITLHIAGYATGEHASGVVQYFRQALSTQRKLIIDLSHTRRLDPRFFGILLMVVKQLKRRGDTLKFTGITPRMHRQFRLNKVEYLLSSD